MLQDILKYFSVINPKPSENRSFDLRRLQLWIVENNWKIRQEYQGFKAHRIRPDMLGKVLPIINIIVIPVVIATASKVVMSIQFTFVLKLHLFYINSMEYSTSILKSLYTKVYS
jgi:hypothetical protein